MTFKDFIKPFDSETKIRVYLQTAPCGDGIEVGIKSAGDWDGRYEDNEVIYANVRDIPHKGVMVNVILY